MSSTVTTPNPTPPFVNTLARNLFSSFFYERSPALRSRQNIESPAPSSNVNAVFDQRLGFGFFESLCGFGFVASIRRSTSSIFF